MQGESCSWVTSTIVLPCLCSLSNSAMISTPLTIQSAGGLIGQQNRGIVDQCAGDRDTLPLPAGKLARLMHHPLLQIDSSCNVSRRAVRHALGEPRINQRKFHGMQRGVARESRLNVWKTNPISLFRMRASSSSSISLTSFPAR